MEITDTKLIKRAENAYYFRGYYKFILGTLIFSWAMRAMVIFLSPMTMQTFWETLYWISLFIMMLLKKSNADYIIIFAEKAFPPEKLFWLNDKNILDKAKSLTPNNTDD
jgi:hypothetical protein